MYLDRFNLQRQPFANVSDSHFFFEGQQRGEILACLELALVDDDGMCVVVGEVGTGKTMLSRQLALVLPERGLTVAFVPDPALDRELLLRCVARDLGLTPTAGQSALECLHDWLLQPATPPRRLVILVDDAQCLRPEGLDALRMLMNVEAGDRRLVQVVLFGQPELDQLVSRYDLRQVRDRIAHRFELQPLDESSAHAYIEHRLRKAGWVGNRLFDPQALRQLLKEAGGRMRALSQLADRALVAAYADSAASVSMRHVQRARHDARAGRRLSAGRLAPGRLARRGLAVAAVAGAAAAAAGAAWTLMPANSPWLDRAGWMRGLAMLDGPLAADTLLDQAPPALGPAPAEGRASMPRATAPAAHTAPPAAPAPAEGRASMPSATALAAPAAPPAAPAPAEVFTVQLVSLPTREAAQVEARRLAEILPDEELQLIARSSSLTPEAAPMWTVTVGRFSTPDEARQARDRLPASLNAMQPLVRKVPA